MLQKYKSLIITYYIELYEFLISINFNGLLQITSQKFNTDKVWSPKVLPLHYIFEVKKDDILILYG